MADEEKKAARPKLATALKRRKQDNKKYLRNKVLKSRIHTARVAFNKAEGEEKKGACDLLFSLIDKAVKKNIYHVNKASRLKSNLTSK